MQNGETGLLIVVYFSKSTLFKVHFWYLSFYGV